MGGGQSYNLNSRDGGLLQANSTTVLEAKQSRVRVENVNTFEVSPPIVASSHITASGNISASGDIMASRLVMGDNIVGGIDNGEFIIGNNAVPVQIKQNYLTVSPGGTDGHITASGNISASGNMVANTGSFNLIEGGVF